MQELERGRGRYRLNAENIFPQTELPIPTLLSERLASLGWPLEIQGSGITDYTNRDFKIYYPVGDVLLSTATVIHEVGHWRQLEIDQFLNRRQNFMEESDIADIPQNEEDAYARGWLRLQRHAPYHLDILDEKIKQYKNQGRLQDIDNFQDIYTKMKDVSLYISILLAGIKSEGMDEESVDMAKYNALKKGHIEDDFENIKNLRVNELIDRDLIERVLLRVSEAVAEE